MSSQNVDQNGLHTNALSIQSETNIPDIPTEKLTQIPTCTGFNAVLYPQDMSSIMKRNSNVKNLATTDCILVTSSQKTETSPLDVGMQGSDSCVCTVPNEQNTPDSSGELVGNNVSSCVCTCCHNIFHRNMCVIFRSHNYDFNNGVVSEALAKQIRYKHVSQQELICKGCHNLLRKRKKTGHKPKMPVDAVASQLKYIQKKTFDSCEINKDNSEVSILTKCSTKSSDVAHFGCERSIDLYVCTCCHRTFRKVMCIVFSEENYNFNHPTISESLSMDIRYKDPNREEYICKSCHRQLCKSNSTPIMPCQAVASPKKGSFHCISCTVLGEKQYSHVFHEKNYNVDNDITSEKITEIKRKCQQHNKAYICSKCHNRLLSFSLVTCIHCSERKKRQQVVIYHREKYVTTAVKHNNKKARWLHAELFFFLVLSYLQCFLVYLLQYLKDTINIIPQTTIRYEILCENRVTQI